MVSFEIFVKAMPPSLSELKVLLSFASLSKSLMTWPHLLNTYLFVHFLSSMFTNNVASTLKPRASLIAPSNIFCLKLQCFSYLKLVRMWMSVPMKLVNVQMANASTR